MQQERKDRRRTRTRMLAEAGILLAAAQLLSFIKLSPEWLQGGSVTAASMLPVLIFAVRWGAPWGLCAGSAFGLLQFLLGTKYASAAIASEVLSYFAVFLLDYLLAYGVLGLAGFFKGRRWGLFFGITVGATARFLAHFVSGLILWSSYAGEEGAFVYSLGYNGSYMGIELAICLVVAVCIYKPLKRYLVTEPI